MKIEDEHFFPKIKTVDYANRHLRRHIEPVVMALPYITSTTEIVSNLRKAPEPIGK